MNKEERLIKAALAVNKCLAKFGDKGGAVGEHGLEYCSEYFDELQSAAYDYEQVERLKGYLNTAHLRLAQIETVAKDEAQPGRSNHINQLSSEIFKILGWIEEEMFKNAGE